MGGLSDDAISVAAGIGRNTVGRARTGKTNPHEASVVAVENLLAQKKRELAGYGAESPERMREMMQNAVGLMSDLAVREMFDSVMQAAMNDMKNRYAPSPSLTLGDGVPPSTDTVTPEKASEKQGAG